MADLRGKVVLIDFWTYTCINCLRTLPYVRAWDERYRDRGLTIVGVHTPEFGVREGRRQRPGRDRPQPPAVPGRAGQRLRHLGRLGQPVLARQVPDRRHRPGPLHALRRGRLRRSPRSAIRSLLAEAGDERLGARAGQPGRRGARRHATPETYLGAARAERWDSRRREPGVHDYPGASGALPARTTSRSAGAGRSTDESAEAVSDATLRARVRGKSVYLVLGSRGRRAAATSTCSSTASRHDARHRARPAALHAR